jgi:hypothetical protein
MASISLPALAAIGAGATALSTDVQAYSSYTQGQATAAADKQKARVEADNETQKQINMRQNMLKALASQNAGTLGAVGTGRGSGFGANAMRQINQAQNDLLVSKANSSAQVSLLDEAAANASATGIIGAAGDEIGGAGKLLGLSGG